MSFRSNHTRQPVFIAATVFVIVGGALLLVVLVSGRGGSTASPRNPSNSTLADAQVQDATETRRGTPLGEHQIEAIALHASSHAPYPGGKRASLQNAIADTLRVYASGTLEDWLAYLDTHGIPRPAVVESNPEFASRLWRSSQDFFRSMRVDSDGTRVVRNSEPGEPSRRDELIDNPATDEPGRFVVRRSGGRDILGAIPESQRETVRVVIPGTFKGMTDALFDGELFMEFTYDPDNRAWIASELAVATSTSERAPSIPPIPF